MTVVLLGAGQRYGGVSTDTKPTSGVNTGATFFEWDTTDTYDYDGSAWAKRVTRVGGYSDIIDVTLVLDTNAYADGDVLVIPQAVSSVVRIPAGCAMLDMVRVLDEDDQGGAFDLLFFDASGVSIGTINQAASMSDADMRGFLGWVRFVAGDYTDWGGQRTASVKRGDSAFKVDILKPASGTSIYVAAISRDTKTYTASGLRVKLMLVKD